MSILFINNKHTSENDSYFPDGQLRFLFKFNIKSSLQYLFSDIIDQFYI